MPQTKPCKVLLVDDSAHMAQIIRTHLADPNIDLAVASTGEEGVEMFRNSHFDLVLMDLHMPDMDGCEATRAIRFWEGRNHRHPTPIAALTADSSKAALSEAYGSGCTLYLPKPIDRNVLLQTIRQYFSASRSRVLGA